MTTASMCSSTTLGRNLGQPQLSEVSDFMAKYFRLSKRKRMETMNEYITRKTEIYARACQALGRVQLRYEPPRTHETNRSYESRSFATASVNHDRPGEEMEEPEGSEHDLREEKTEDLREEAEKQSTGHQSAKDDWSGWGRDWWAKAEHYDYGWWNKWNSHWGNDWSTQRWQDSGWSQSYLGLNIEEIPELLPPFVQGWFLLQDSGLDAHGRCTLETGGPGAAQPVARRRPPSPRSVRQGRRMERRATRRRT